MRLSLKLLAMASILSWAIWPGARPIVVQGQPTVSELFQKLQSSQTTDQAAEQLLKLGKSDAAAKQYLADHLPALIEKGPTYVPQWPGSQWLSAVRLAGELKIVEAAPALAKWISVSTSSVLTLSGESHLRTSPTGTALVQIGDPAIPALRDLLEQNGQWRAAYALNLIGSPKAKAALREHATHEPDESMVQFINKATSK
jgi:hypothetical protein